MNLKFLTIQKTFLCRSKFVNHSLMYSIILTALFPYSMVYNIIGSYQKLSEGLFMIDPVGHGKLDSAHEPGLEGVGLGAGCWEGA